MEYDSSYSNFFLPESGSKPPSTPMARRVIFFSGPSLCCSVGIYKKKVTTFKTLKLNCSKRIFFCLVRIIWINTHTYGQVRKTMNKNSSPTVCLGIITPPTMPTFHTFPPLLICILVIILSLPLKLQFVLVYIGRCTM